MTLLASDNRALCPTDVDLTNSEIILKDDGEDNHGYMQEFAYNLRNGVINPNNTAINIENSSDVIIGPVTQFHGPVTIYQRPLSSPEGSVQSSDNEKDIPQSGNTEIRPEEKLDKNEEIHKNYHSIKDCSHHLKSKFAKIVLVVVIVTIALIIILCTTLLFGNEDEPPTPKPPIDPPKIGNHSLLYREVWGGAPPLNFTRPLFHPTSLVIISHTVSPFCTTISECSERVRSAQTLHVNNHSPDIGYNFLIGGDGNIYVGRDWDIRNFHRDNSIGISFIGNFIYDYLSDSMVDAISELIKYGVEKGKLHENYTVVCHNQTMITESPGVHVYELVSKWPHFRPGSLDGH